MKSYHVTGGTHGWELALSLGDDIFLLGPLWGGVQGSGAENEVGWKPVARVAILVWALATPARLRLEGSGQWYLCPVTLEASLQQV